MKIINRKKFIQKLNQLSDKIQKSKKKETLKNDLLKLKINQENNFLLKLVNKYKNLI